MPDRQSSLDRVVEQLATQIASGRITPAPLELEALAKICDNAGRGDLADRVRRWLGDVTRARVHAILTAGPEDLF